MAKKLVTVATYTLSYTPDLVQRTAQTALQNASAAWVQRSISGTAVGFSLDFALPYDFPHEGIMPPKGKVIVAASRVQMNATDVIMQIEPAAAKAAELDKFIKKFSRGLGAIPKEAQTPAVQAAVKRALKKTASAVVFMSYRRSDSADVSGRVYDRLVGEFGHDTVFKDVDDIPFGVDFRQHIREVMQQCQVVLVMIGPQWAAVKQGGKRRLSDAADPVRVEIEIAFNLGLQIIPVLVGGASMPAADELPASIQELAYRNAAPVRQDPDFHRDMDRLINGIESIVK